MDAEVPKVLVGPPTEAWTLPLEQAVRSAGGQVVTSGEAEAVVWLGIPGGSPDLAEVLHPDVRWVQVRSAGVDGWIKRGQIDAERLWTSARGVYAQTVAEHALALVLAGAKQIARCARGRNWDRSVQAGNLLLCHSTVMVVGAGGIGEELVRYLRPLCRQVVAVTRSGNPVAGADRVHAAAELDRLWPEADVVVLCVPSTPATRPLVGADELNAMPPHAWLVNVGRGDAVDTDALVRALRAGSIAGAALDVCDPEPLPSDHPLWDEPRALLTPHVANPDHGQLPRLCAFVEDNVRRFASGQPLRGVIDLGAGY